MLKPLSYHINAANCRLTIKSNSISLTLKKEDSKPWVNLTKTSGGPSLGGGKKDPAADIDNNDPQASLMKMMANLYQTGDDDMKRTITESFAKA